MQSLPLPIRPTVGYKLKCSILYNYAYLYIVISMPPILKKRGRPKGHELTVVGLPAKRLKRGVKEKVKPFVKLHSTIKEKGMFSYEFAKHLSRVGKKFE